MEKNLKFYISKGLRKFLNPPSIRGSKLDKTVRIWDGCIISDVNIGKYTYVSSNTRIVSTEIGAFCSISSLCQIGVSDHSLGFVSTSPVFDEGRNPLKKNFASFPFENYKKTTIGNDVWIGANCCIKSGIHIADGAVIGMGAVVTKDVGPYEIWGGNPARLIRKRFDDDTIAKLLEIKWWNMSDKNIEKYAHKFDNPQDFIKEVKI